MSIYARNHEIDKLKYSKKKKGEIYAIKLLLMCSFIFLQINTK